MAGVLHAAVLTVNATAKHAKARAINRPAKASRTASHGPMRERAMEKTTKTMENPSEKSKGLKGSKHSNKR